MTKYLSLSILFFATNYFIYAQDRDDFFTVYLVRHAEKDASGDYPRDPPLTPCGVQRAESLADFLEMVELDAIYSSDYLRTKNTAQPTAKAKALEIQLYDPGYLHDMAKQLIERKEDALVVGHSNTTPVLAGLLIEEEMSPMEETVYDRIYQVVMSKKTGRLHVLHSSFRCSE